ncbi:zinc finger protein CONSTANS-LIKE 7 [Ricinus communis]|nr:zinc finger protein CONSTANS-LIKE 7 [Ricinus communis]
MKYNSPLKNPKKEEVEVPDATLAQFSNVKESYNDSNSGGIGAMDELEVFLGIEDDSFCKDNEYGTLSCGLMDWEEETPNEKDEDGPDNNFEKRKVIKTENIGFFDEGDDDKRASLNLNLNYQQVLDAWFHRGSLLANDNSVYMPSNGYYMGEVLVMEEERIRREASVLRYKEKRQTRLFSKKIRYQVRKLNADKRPRLKGRFIKRSS